MKIVTWNCNGALRKKFDSIVRLRADIYIIQECEDPARTLDNKYCEWARNYLWIGDNKNKGVGVFANPNIDLKRLDWSDAYEGHFVRYFLPCLINNDFQLLAVWAHKNNSPNFGYIGQFWKYLKTNFHLFDNIIIAGDFNSNVIWDEWDRWWNHTDILKTLNEKKILSLYHQATGEEQGKEHGKTFFLQRKKEKAYHIDYFFGSSNFHNPKAITLGSFKEWIEISDHVTLTVEFER